MKKIIDNIIDFRQKETCYLEECCIHGLNTLLAISIKLFLIILFVDKQNWVVLKGGDCNEQVKFFMHWWILKKW